MLCAIVDFGIYLMLRSRVLLVGPVCPGIPFESGQIERLPPNTQREDVNQRRARLGDAFRLEGAPAPTGAGSIWKIAFIRERRPGLH